MINHTFRNGIPSAFARQKDRPDIGPNKRETVMIGFANHYTMKHPLGFRWFSPPGEMPPLLFGGKVGTVMIGFANHYTTFVPKNACIL